MLFGTGREIAAFEQERDELRAQTCDLPIGFTYLYMQRNQRTAPYLEGNWDDAGLDIYDGMSPRMSYTSPGVREANPALSAHEAAAIAGRLQSQGRRSLDAARRAFDLRNVGWLELKGEDNATVMSTGRARQVGQRDVRGTMRRFARSDIALVGPRTESYPLTLAMGVADCLAMPLIDTRTEAFGFVHAGRAGTALRAVARAVRTMAERFGSDPNDIRAHVGEGICTTCHTVGEKGLAQFVRTFGGKTQVDHVLSQFPSAVYEIEEGPEPRYAINLHSFNSYLLHHSGVSEVTRTKVCTARLSETCLDKTGIANDIPEADQLFYSHERVKDRTVQWQTASGQWLPLQAGTLGTPRNLATITRR